MYAVLEEIEEQKAVLIPDFSNDVIIVPVSELPQSYTLGDVFSIEKGKDGWEIIASNPEEKQKRMNANKEKRQMLLNRTRDRNKE